MRQAPTTPPSPEGSDSIDAATRLANRRRPPVPEIPGVFPGSDLKPLLKLGDLPALTGLGMRTIDRKRKLGTFPVPIKIPGSGTNPILRWKHSDIQAFLRGEWRS